MSTDLALGIDIGGTGIKGAVVNVRSGELLTQRLRIPTPRPSTPQAVAEVVVQVATHFDDDLPPGAPVGVAFPGVVQRGVVRTAANVDNSWIDLPAQELFSSALGCPTVLVNDADAAGIAEHRLGAARECSGLVIVTTLGTGIGVALINGGRLLPNAELGHLEVNGRIAETWASASARDREDLSYKAWASRLQRYYSHLEALLWPEIIVVGGGKSRKADKFLPRLDLRTPIVPAELRNTAGIVGAACLAADGVKR